MFHNFLEAYIDALLWTCDDDAPGGEYQQDQTEIEIHVSLLRKSYDDCLKFWVENKHLITNADQAGHDFLLTRDHHGVGFWDRNLGNIGDQLTNASEAFCESNEGLENGVLY